MIKQNRFHHIGYAVNNIDDTSVYYLSQGWKLSQKVVDEIQNAQIAFLSREGEPLIELVAPINAESPVNKTLMKSGVTPYHICFEVDDIDAAILEMKKMKFILLFKPVEAIAINNRRICYLYSKKNGLIELLEMEK